MRRIVWPDCRREGWYYICAGPPDRAQYRRDRRRVHVDFLCVYVYTRDRECVCTENIVFPPCRSYTLWPASSRIYSFPSIFLSIYPSRALSPPPLYSLLSFYTLFSILLLSSLSLSIFLSLLSFPFSLPFFLCLSPFLSVFLSLSLSLPLTLLALAQFLHSMRIPPCYSPRCFARDRAHCSHYSSRSARHVWSDRAR